MNRPGARRGNKGGLCADATLIGNEVQLIRMVAVDSAVLEAVGYEPESRRLHARFTDRGALYVYSDVPPEVYSKLIAADSKGEYFNREIRNIYSVSRVVAEGEASEKE